MSIITLGTRVRLEWDYRVDGTPTAPTTFRLVARTKGSAAREVEITDHEVTGTLVVASWKPPAAGVWVCELEVTEPIELVEPALETVVVRPR